MEEDTRPRTCVEPWRRIPRCCRPPCRQPLLRVARYLLTNTENIEIVVDALIQKLSSSKVHLGDRELEREFLAAHRLRDKLREMN